MRVGNRPRSSIRDLCDRVYESVRHQTHVTDKVEMSPEELTERIEQILGAFEQENMEELNALFHDFCLSLTSTRKFGADAVQLFIESPAMHVLLSVSDGPVGLFRQSLVLLEHVIVQSPDILRLFVENDGLRLVLSRINFLEDVTILESFMRILAIGCRIPQFCEILCKEEAWIPRYFVLFSTSDVSLVRAALIFLPSFIRVYPEQIQNAISLGTNAIQRSLVRAITNNQWFDVYDGLLWFFAFALFHFPPIVRFFATSGALATTFMLLQTFPRRCLLRCLTLIRRCYKTTDQNAELFECLHNLQQRFAVSPPDDVCYVTLAEREWIKPFRYAMASEREEARNGAISTLKTLIDFDSSLLKDVVEGGIPEQVRRICKEGSFASKAKVLKLVHAVLLRADCDFFQTVFVTSRFISVLGYLLHHESYYHAARSILLDLSDLTCFNRSRTSAIQELLEEADRLGPPPVSPV